MNREAITVMTPALAPLKPQVSKADCPAVMF